MTLRVGETGKTLRVNAGFDMSSYTELKLTFTKPDNTTVSYTDATATSLTLGSVAVTDDDLGALVANEYVEFEVESGLLDTAGEWCVYLTYTNTTPNPDDIFIGQPASFEVYDTSC